MDELSPKQKHDRILAELAKLPALGGALLDGGSLIEEAERGIAALNPPEEVDEGPPPTPVVPQGVRQAGYEKWWEEEPPRTVQESIWRKTLELLEIDEMSRPVGLPFP